MIEGKKGRKKKAIQPFMSGSVHKQQSKQEKKYI
jgi:hypothetical protein